jgi:Holliday junction resolvasome RuvABC DNA-binding subunit
LAELGYSNPEIRRAMAAIDGSEPIEQALRLALRELSRA